MNPFDIIHQYYTPTDLNYQVLIQHSTLVTAKAISIARRRNIQHPEQQADLEFIAEAGMLHDIGILETDADDIGCFGTHPYIYHVVAGYEILMKHNLPRHARVAVSHTGVGIFPDEIVARHLPLPTHLEYTPQTLEEKIISYADLFFTKSLPQLLYERSSEEARASVSKFGAKHQELFDEREMNFGK